ncbi:hypothetical protein HYT74_02010 [Candidatus Daviesbacteria bacterium]|nr:hypothetical protein [Candidatus Daviesbacteria bacterium]
MRSSDIDLLKTFKECLSIQNDICETHNNGFAKKPSYRIQFGNVQFYRWLLTIGLFPAKTYTVGEISVPDLYFRDFLREHLDGDGTVLTYIDEHNKYKGRGYSNLRVMMYFISASQSHIKWLHKRIQYVIDVKGSLNCREAKNPSYAPMWRIKFSKKESLKLLQWMYYQPNLPCLERKKKLVLKIFNLIANEERKIYTLA